MQVIKYRSMNRISGKRAKRNSGMPKSLTGVYCIYIYIYTYLIPLYTELEAAKCISESHCHGVLVSCSTTNLQARDLDTSRRRKAHAIAGPEIEISRLSLSRTHLYWIYPPPSYSLPCQSILLLRGKESFGNEDGVPVTPLRFRLWIRKSYNESLAFVWHLGV